MSWSRGQTIVVEEVWRGRIWSKRPVIVAEDRGDFLALWCPKGTKWKAPTTDPQRPWKEDRGERLADCAVGGEWVFRDGEWDVDTLWLLEDGAEFAVWVSWLDGSQPWGWYVNLQEPFRRRATTLQTMDWMLDVIVELDRSWRWKDEEELETFVRRGAFDPELARRARAAGLEAIRRAHDDEPPFSEPWHDWRPDPGWGLPTLP